MQAKLVENSSQTGPWLLRELQPPVTRQDRGGCGAGALPGPQALALLLRLCGQGREDLLESSSLYPFARLWKPKPEAATVVVQNSPGGMHGTTDGCATGSEVR